jgi:exonuclease SbcC
MRPLKVTMIAFGTYKNQETVDFTELNGHKLFVISGNTGAGKTTIFDAICFALYGDASGEDRNDTRMLRSDFADNEVHTAVDFEFEIKGRTYRVFRQLAHVKVGNKVATGDKYELYETTNGNEVPLTDRFIVSQVNGKIQEIIGLTKEQFSQIVMLPQGEFRKLLTSETENKEEILRRIFKTSFYKSVAEHLNLRRKDTQKVFDEREKAREVHVENLKASLPSREDSELFIVFTQEYFNTHQVLLGLENEIQYYEQEEKGKREELKEKTESLQEHNKQYHLAQAINERFDQLTQKRSLKDRLMQQEDEMQAKEQAYIQAEKASHLEVIEKHYEDTRNEVINKQKGLQEAEETKQGAEEKQQLTNLAYIEEERKAKERESVTLELQRLHEYQPTVKELENKKKSIHDMQNKVKELTAKVKEIELELKSKQKERLEISNAINPLEMRIRTLPEKTELIASMREKANVLKDYLRLYKSTGEDYKQAQTEKVRLDEVEKQFEKLEHRWIEGQASTLATHLHEGKPCPVCGSEVHPKKAMFTNDIPTKEELELMRKEKRKIEQSYSNAEAKSSSSLQQLNDKKQELIGFGMNPDLAREQFVELTSQGKQLNVEIEVLKTELQQLDMLKGKLSSVEKDIESISNANIEVTNQLGNKKADLQTENSLYEQSLVNIPKELRSLELLEIRINETKQKKQQLEEKWKKVHADFQAANEKLAAAKANYNNALNALSEMKGKKEKTERDFLEAIERLGFENVEDYKLTKMIPEARESLKIEIEEFKQALNTVSIQIAELDKELENQQYSDLTLMKQTLEGLERQVEKTRTMLQKTQNYLEKAQDGKTKILQSEKELKEVETHLQLIKDLYDVVRGENSKKISFERYLQIEFLEQIIQAANERLKRLSNGQYVLVRSDRLEKRGKQSGLGLDVLDNYTGQFRDVKSLSGGEKFNASLCLALGMADVIQAYEGGISIETMFIDEGFGSLDEESLNKAIDTLIDLQQSGRMIGVISHVQELKQAIPAILEVKKTKEGFSETKFVVK